MTLARTGPSPRPAQADEPELPLYRLHLMRVGYRVTGVGLAVVPWRYAWQWRVIAKGDR